VCVVDILFVFVLFVVVVVVLMLLLSAAIRSRWSVSTHPHTTEIAERSNIDGGSARSPYASAVPGNDPHFPVQRNKDLRSEIEVPSDEKKREMAVKGTDVRRRYPQ
jgi:hypothetical protein